MHFTSRFTPGTSRFPFKTGENFSPAPVYRKLWLTYIIIKEIKFYFSCELIGQNYQLTFNAFRAMENFVAVLLGGCCFGKPLAYVRTHPFDFFFSYKIFAHRKYVGINFFLLFPRQFFILHWEPGSSFATFFLRMLFKTLLECEWIMWNCMEVSLDSFFAFARFAFINIFDRGTNERTNRLRRRQNFWRGENFALYSFHCVMRKKVKVSKKLSDKDFHGNHSNRARSKLLSHHSREKAKVNI